MISGKHTGSQRWSGHLRVCVEDHACDDHKLPGKNYKHERDKWKNWFQALTVNKCCYW